MKRLSPPFLKSLALAALGVVILATHSLPLASEAGATREYTVKGAFLYNFAQFVDWPVTAFAPDQSSFTIGILGTNPFDSALESLSSQSVKDRKIRVRTLGSIEEARECQLLFISASERGRLQQILTALRKSPVLTVSDIDGFAASGGMIHFVTLEDKVRFEINLKEARAANLKLSSQLLKLARDVIN